MNDKTLNLYKSAVGAALILLVIVLCLVFAGKVAVAGPFLIAALVLLAVGVRGFKLFRSLSYTIWIFAAVALSMYYPQYFQKAGDFELKKMIVPLLQIIMFGMGSQMSVKDFTGVIKMPKGVFIGITAHYIIMPGVGFAIANLFNFPPEIAAGILLIGCAPSGLASNVMSYIAKANLALAVTVAAISTLISPLLTPLLMKLLAGQFIEVNVWKMMLEIINMIILPVVAGFVFNLFFHRKETRRNMIIQLAIYFFIIILKNSILLKTGETSLSHLVVAFLKDIGWFVVLPAVGAYFLSRLTKGNNQWMEKVLSFVSMLGIAVIITVITAAGRDSLLQVGGLLLLATLIHNLSGYALGYSFARLSGMPERDCRTIAFEVGMQNGGLASGLAMQMGKIATVGLAPAIFGPLMNITGSTLANYWRNKTKETETNIN
jgi:BASS family bile acid:Na+ symporter